MAEPGGSDKRVGIVDRAARILACFSRGEPELGLAQIAQRVGLPKPTAFRILGELVRHGLVDHNRDTSRYTLGFAPLRFADALLGGIALRSHARPAMQAVRDAVNETVILSLRDGDQRINIDCVESRQPIAQVLQLGVRIPLYAGAASQVLLAGMSDAEIEAYLRRTPLERFSSTTITEAHELRQRVRKLRRDGYAISTGEFTQASNSMAIAVPLHNRGGTVLGALHVSAPRARLTPDLQKNSLASLAGAARSLAQDLD